MKLVIERQGCNAVVMIWTAQLDRNNVRLFLSLMSPILTRCAHVVIDLRRITHIDPHGVGGLLICRKRLRKRGGRLTLCKGHEAGDYFPDLYRRAGIFADADAA